MAPATVSSTPAIPASRGSPFGLTPLLEESWALLRAHPVALLTPLVLLSLITGADGDDGRARFDVTQVDPDPLVWIPFFAFFGLLALAIGIVLFVAYVWAGLATTRAALTFAGETAASGAREPSIVELFLETRPLLWRGLGTWLLWLVCVVAGFIALVVPGFIVLAALVPLAAVVVSEGIFGSHAIARTWRLTRGHRWALFGAIFLAMLATVLISIAVSWLPVIGGALASAGAGAVQVFLVVLGVVYYRRARDADSLAATPASPT